MPTQTDVLKSSQAWIFSQSSMKKVSLTDKSLTASFAFPISDTIYNAVIDGNSIMYISGQNYMYRYSLGNYPQSSSYYFTEDAKKFNPNQDMILAIGKDDLLSAQTYYGNVTIRDKNTLEQIVLFGNVDSPFEAVWSEYHQSYLVIGNNGLWKINRNGIDLVFSVDGYILKDFAANQNGQVCLSLTSSIDSKDIIKVLDSDFYKNVSNSYYEYGSIKSVTIAGEVFYAIQETPPTKDKYNGNGILINPKTKTIDTIPIQATIQKQTATSPTTTSKTIEITSPSVGDTWAIGNEYSIQWLSSKGSSENVSIQLLKADEIVLVVTDKTSNSGNYKWKVPSNIEISSDYTLKVTWLTSSQNDSNEGVSDTFAISDTEPPPEEVEASDYITGASYDSFTNSVVITFYSGYVGVHDLGIRKFYGLYLSGLKGVEGCAANNDQLKQFTDASGVRIFVGTDKYLNDKWDSGVVTTKLTSMYYGGGNNLTPGDKYYVHIQVYSEKYGWSEMQIKEFVMPL